MQTESNVFRAEFRHDLERLTQLRDEIRVRIHLAGLDARTRFEHLEAEAAKLGREASYATHRTTRELLAKFEELGSII